MSLGMAEAKRRAIFIEEKIVNKDSPTILQFTEAGTED